MTKTGKELLGVIAVVVVIFVCQVIWAAYVYGEWTCAFSECRRVVV